MNRPGQVKCVPLRVGIHAARTQRSGEGRSVGRPPGEDSRRQPPLWLPALLPTPIPAAARPWGQSVFQGELDPSPLPPLQGREKDHRDELPSLGLDKPEWQSAAASTSLVWSPGSGGVWGAGRGAGMAGGIPGHKAAMPGLPGSGASLADPGQPKGGPDSPSLSPGCRRPSRAGRAGCAWALRQSCCRDSLQRPDVPRECGAGTTRLARVCPGSRPT